MKGAQLYFLFKIELRCVIRVGNKILCLLPLSLPSADLSSSSISILVDTALVEQSDDLRSETTVILTERKQSILDKA